MTKRPALALIFFFLIDVFPAPVLAAGSPNGAAADPARAALAKGGYPWYDSARDRLRPVDSALQGESNWLRSIDEWINGVTNWFGDLFARISRALHLPSFGSFRQTAPAVLIGVGIILLAVLVRFLWKSPGFEGKATSAVDCSVGGAARTSLIPEAVAAAAADPWAEAVERRRRGDYSGAAVYLFAHQLRELERFGLIRRIPAGTGRRYVRSVADLRLRELLAAPLDLFEQAYYGRKCLTAACFEPVWARAPAFQARLDSVARRTP